MHFTGQSLGGGLAQYAAYFYAKLLDVAGLGGNLAARMSLIEFNGFGALAGIDYLERNQFNNLPPAQYNPNLIADVPTLHYAIANDIVHRLGTGDPKLIAGFDGSWHVNGKGNSYVLDFRRFKDNAPDVGRNRLGIVDAHRIESGFYRGFSNYAADFSTAPYLSTGAYSYIDTRLSQNVAAFLSHVFSDGKTDTLSASARISLGLVASSASGPVSELEAIKHAVVEALYESGAIDSPGRAALSIGTSAVVVKTVVNRALGAVNPVLGVLGWLFSFGLEFFKGMSSSDKQAATQELNKLLPEDRQIQYQSAEDPASSSADRAMRYKLYSVHSLKYVDPEDRQALLKTDDMRRLFANLASLDTDPDEFGARLMSDHHYVRNALSYFAQATNDATSLGTVEKQFTIGMLESEMSRFARLVGAEDPEFTNRMRADLGDFQRDYAYALSNANPEAAVNNPTPITLTASTSFADTRNTADAFLETLSKFGEAALTLLSGSSEANAAEVEQEIRQIRDTVQTGAQTIVLHQGRSPNPFASHNFDPNASISLGALSESSVRTFTLYLPYDAGTGGQRVKLTLAGSAADKLAVLEHADEVALGPDGTFTLVVPEGRKELSFGLWAKGDIDAGATLALSAQLVDAADEATHLEHVELNLALDGVDETPPVTTREIRGDWAAKPWTDPATGVTYAYRYDDLGNIERDPGVPSTGDVELDQWLDGSAGADYIFTGDFDEQASGGAGDDFIVGSDASGNVLAGGAGNDYIEGGGWADHAAGDEEFDLLGVTVGLGDDKIYGGAGDDQIWGESAAD
ncbi:MAG: calcium-binding protein, partial [Burkholderiales bacterium]